MKRTLIISMFIAAALMVGCKNNGKDAGEEVNASDVQTEAAEAQTDQAAAQESQPVSTPADTYANLPEEPVFSIMTSMGTMKVKLYSDTPLHRDNFIKLARQHYYDGILFHRVINGFMIQVGDPLTKDSTQVAKWGTGGPGYTIPAEIVSGHTHKKGALAAARLGDKVNPAKESSGSQFYIVQDENGCKHLDGEYTIFGEVVEGFDVIDKIAGTKKGPKDRPLNPIQIFSVSPEK